MADPTTATKLQAVNTILSAIGELPTTQGVLDAGSSADVSMAEQILDEVNREVQMEGWHFNTDSKITFTPNASNLIVVPDNVVRITASGYDITIRYTGTARQLYNKTDNTYEFLSPLTEEAVVVYLFDFYGIPEPAKRYITIRAARLFQDRMVGSASHHKFSERDEFKALLDLKEYEGSTARDNIFSDVGVFNIIKRGSIL